MKYLGEETKVEVKTKSVREVEYLRCDRCGKKILPAKFSTKGHDYVLVHTWHDDWGHDSIESHVYRECCKECAKSVVSEYIDRMNGSEKLELMHQYLYTSETCEDYEKDDYGYDLVEEDRHKEAK